jgi:ABC-type nickel/cobalt efflux system permease component RcnA
MTAGTGAPAGNCSTAGFIHRHDEPGSLVLRRDQFMEEADGGHERLCDGCGHKHVDGIQQLLGGAVEAAGIDGGESARRER